MRIGLLEGEKLSIEDSRWLERDFTMEELDRALRESSDEKAPLKNLNMGCLKFLWKNMRVKLFEDFSLFTKDGTLPKGMNSSFISLLSKVDCPTLVTDFGL